MCNKVPTPPTSLCLPPSFICGWGMQGERGEESGRVSPPVTLSHNTVRATGLMLSSSTPTHTSTESETRWERERVRERGTARRERRGEREGHSKGDKKKQKTQKRENKRIFSFSPEELLRITLGEGWQKGERERRRFSSCERWVLLTLLFRERLTCTGCRRGAWGWRRRWGVTRSEMSEKGNQMQLIYTLCDSTLDLKLTRDLPASTLFLHWFHSFSTFSTFAFLAVDI